MNLRTHIRISSPRAIYGALKNPKLETKVRVGSKTWCSSNNGPDDRNGNPHFYMWTLYIPGRTEGNVRYGGHPIFGIRTSPLYYIIKKD